MAIEDHKNPDGTYNGVNALAEVTGLGSDEILSIAEQVKANQNKLNACLYHDFELIPDSANAASFRQKYRCLSCGGEIDGRAYRWHELGRRQQQPRRQRLITKWKTHEQDPRAIPI